MEKKKKLRKDRVLSTFIPLIIIIVIGGFLGNRVIGDKNSENNVTNQVINSTSNENILIQNNTNNINIEKEEEKETIKEDNIEKEQSHKKVKLDETTAFIGDSRTQGFIMYNGLNKVQDYSYIGLMVDTAISKEFIKTSNGNKITLIKDMESKNIERVYIMLGLNELGWAYPQVFKAKYEELIDKIRQTKPNCEIYVQSIIPVTKTKDKSDKIFNNTRIKQYNQLVKEVVNEKNVKYLDVQTALVNSEGYLPEEASTDGIHLGKTYCEKWLEYLKNNS